MVPVRSNFDLSISIPDEAVFNDSIIRAAALPVGAASATFNAGLMVNRIDNILATVVVFPVPGPPVIIVKLFNTAVMAAAKAS